MKSYPWISHGYPKTPKAVHSDGVRFSDATTSNNLMPGPQHRDIATGQAARLGQWPAERALQAVQVNRDLH